MEFFLITTTMTLLMLGPHIAHSHRILIMPMSFGLNSRTLNLEKMAGMLADAVHEVHLMTAASIAEQLTTTKARIIPVCII